MDSHGIISHTSSRPPDYLFRVSLKCLIRDSEGRVLVVQEVGRDWWDLPGGGMDHGEDLKTAIAREMAEEVNMQGDFKHKILHAEDPMFLPKHNFWQARLIFEVIPEVMSFNVGIDSTKIAFIDANILKDSERGVERLAHYYSTLLN